MTKIVTKFDLVVKEFCDAREGIEQSDTEIRMRLEHIEQLQAQLDAAKTALTDANALRARHIRLLAEAAEKVGPLAWSEVAGRGARKAPSADTTSAAAE